MSKSDILFIPYIAILVFVAPQPFIPRAIVIMGGVIIYNLVDNRIIKRKK